MDTTHLIGTRLWEEALLQDSCDADSRHFVQMETRLEDLLPTAYLKPLLLGCQYLEGQTGRAVVLQLDLWYSFFFNVRCLFTPLPRTRAPTFLISSHKVINLVHTRTHVCSLVLCSPTCALIHFRVTGGMNSNFTVISQSLAPSRLAGDVWRRMRRRELQTEGYFC